MGCLGNSSRHGWFSTIRSMHTLLPSMAMAIWKNWNILIITHGWFGRYPIFWVGDFKYHPGWWLFGVIFLLWLGDVHSAAITPLPKASGWKKSPLNSCGSVWAFLQFCWSRQVDDCRCLVHYVHCFLLEDVAHSQVCSIKLGWFATWWLIPLSK